MIKKKKNNDKEKKKKKMEPSFLGKCASRKFGAAVDSKLSDELQQDLSHGLAKREKERKKEKKAACALAESLLEWWALHCPTRAPARSSV
jgi:hypothetical protein